MVAAIMAFVCSEQEMVRETKEVNQLTYHPPADAKVSFRNHHFFITSCISSIFG